MFQYQESEAVHVAVLKKTPATRATNTPDSWCLKILLLLKQEFSLGFSQELGGTATYLDNIQFNKIAQEWRIINSL